MHQAAGEDNTVWRKKTYVSLNDILYLIEIHKHLKNEESFLDIFIAFCRFNRLYNRGLRTMVLNKMIEYDYLLNNQAFWATFRQLSFHLLSFYDRIYATEQERIEIRTLDHFLDTGSFL